MLLAFVETPMFTESAAELTDDELRAAQDALRTNPDAGRLVPQTGGARKLRIGHRGKDKRGGARVMCYYAPSVLRVYLLLMYPKGVADT
ncbi:MAG: hypothetical protein ACREON_08230, partial [Gemmatimonadaceae bacterium]